MKDVWFVKCLKRNTKKFRSNQGNVFIFSCIISFFEKKDKNWFWAEVRTNEIIIWQSFIISAGLNILIPPGPPQKNIVTNEGQHLNNHAPCKFWSEIFPQLLPFYFYFIFRSEASLLETLSFCLSVCQPVCLSFCLPPSILMRSYLYWVIISRRKKDIFLILQGYKYSLKNF